MFAVRIYFANASVNEQTFASFTAARDYCRSSISYSSGKISRVEIIERGNAPRAVWDATWNAASQRAGLSLRGG